MRRRARFSHFPSCSLLLPRLTRGLRAWGDYLGVKTYATLRVADVGCECTYLPGGKQSVARGDGKKYRCDSARREKRRRGERPSDGRREDLVISKGMAE